jgi:hypothetical protein
MTAGGVEKDLNKAGSDRSGSMVTMALAFVYLTLMISCLWVALVERDGWKDACRQRSNDYKTVASGGQ